MAAFIINFVNGSTAKCDNVSGFSIIDGHLHFFRDGDVSDVIAAGQWTCAFREQPEKVDDAAR